MRALGVCVSEIVGSMPALGASTRSRQSLRRGRCTAKLPDRFRPRARTAPCVSTALDAAAVPCPIPVFGAAVACRCIRQISDRTVGGGRISSLARRGCKGGGASRRMAGALPSPEGSIAVAQRFHPAQEPEANGKALCFCRTGRCGSDADCAGHGCGALSPGGGCAAAAAGRGAGTAAGSGGSVGSISIPSGRWARMRSRISGRRSGLVR